MNEELDEEPQESSPPMSRSQALVHINELLKYFCQIGDNSLDYNFNEMQLKIAGNTFKNLRQTKISDFLT